MTGPPDSLTDPKLIPKLDVRQIKCYDIMKIIIVYCKNWNYDPMHAIDKQFLIDR